MTIEIKTPELEALILRKLRTGDFHDVDALLFNALSALPERLGETGNAAQTKQNFAQFLMESPLSGSGLELERPRDYPRLIEL